MFGLGLFSFIVYAAVTSAMSSDAGIWAKLSVIGLIIMIACGFASVVLFAKANEVGKEAGKRQPQDLPSTDSTKELLTEGHFEPVPSVTDRTTELLPVEKRDTGSR